MEFDVKETYEELIRRVHSKETEYQIALSERRNCKESPKYKWNRAFWAAIRNRSPSELDSVLQRAEDIPDPEWGWNPAESEEIFLSRPYGYKTPKSQPQPVSPFRYLCGLGDIPCMEVLLRHGSMELNREYRGRFKNHDSARPLHIATANGNLECTRFLLAQGADPYLRLRNSYTCPLDIAIYLGQIEMIEFWSAEAPGLLYHLRYPLNMALHSPMNKRLTDTVRNLLRQVKRFDLKWLEMCGPCGQPPLALAVSRSYYECVVLMLRAGADPLMKYDRGYGDCHSCPLLDAMIPFYNGGIEGANLLLSCTTSTVPLLSEETRLQYRMQVYFRESLVERILDYL